MSKAQAGKDTTHTLRWNNEEFMSFEMQRSSSLCKQEEWTAFL